MKTHRAVTASKLRPLILSLVLVLACP